MFTHYPLGELAGGETVEVTLAGSAANVLLLDDPNFHAYRSGRQYRYHGGHVTRSPFRVRVPRAGRWHVAIDLGGFGGNVRSAVRVL
jgi:hypothetical protein